MLEISILLGQEGILKQLEASGHASGAKKGENIACAAASVLVRTAAILIENEKRVENSGSAEREGLFSLHVHGYEHECAKWLRGVCDFLVEGLKSIEREYPDSIQLSIRNSET